MKDYIKNLIDQMYKSMDVKDYRKYNIIKTMIGDELLKIDKKFKKEIKK